MENITVIIERNNDGSYTNGLRNHPQSAFATEPCRPNGLPVFAFVMD